MLDIGDIFCGKLLTGRGFFSLFIILLYLHEKNLYFRYTPTFKRSSVFSRSYRVILYIELDDKISYFICDSFAPSSSSHYCQPHTGRKIPLFILRLCWQEQVNYYVEYAIELVTTSRLQKKVTQTTQRPLQTYSQFWMALRSLHLLCAQLLPVILLDWKTPIQPLPLVPTAHHQCLMKTSKRLFTFLIEVNRLRVRKYCYLRVEAELHRLTRTPNCICFLGNFFENK